MIQIQPDLRQRLEGMLSNMFKRENQRRQALASAHVVPETVRCVQCGICSYNCPLDIDVRRHALLGKPVVDRHCLTCGECVARCPRGVLRFETISDMTEAAK